MSTQYGKLISLILLEHFGEVVERVALFLYKSGSCHLSLIAKCTELPVSKVRPTK